MNKRGGRKEEARKERKGPFFKSRAIPTTTDHAKHTGRYSIPDSVAKKIALESYYRSSGSIVVEIK